MAKWTFIAQNVVILCSQRCSERSATLGTTGTQGVQSYQHWELHQEYLADIENCAKSVLPMLEPVQCEYTVGSTK
jgi:hypothetical protein